MRGSLRLFSEEDVKEILRMGEVIEAVEAALRDLSLGRAAMPIRARIETGMGDILTMPGYVPSLGLMTAKVVGVYPGNPSRGLELIQGALLAMRADTGEPLATIMAKTLTAIRTGAASGVATKHLSRRDSAIAGIIGSGTQAWTQLEAVMAVRRLVEARVYSPRREHRESFAARASRELGVRCVPTSSGEEAVRGADIVITATTSRDPVIRRDWLGEGTHINAIGSHTPDKREIDEETVLSSKIVVDHLDSVRAEAGDLIIPVSRGLMSWERVYAELGEIAAGLKPGRASGDEITLFKSVGLAVEDTAAAAVLLRKAGLL